MEKYGSKRDVRCVATFAVLLEYSASEDVGQVARMSIFQGNDLLFTYRTDQYFVSVNKTL